MSRRNISVCNTTVEEILGSCKNASAYIEEAVLFYTNLSKIERDNLIDEASNRHLYNLKSEISELKLEVIELKSSVIKLESRCNKKKSRKK